MSVEFSNTYQEILLDNLVSIIKQNFVFQTQLKLAENDARRNPDQVDGGVLRDLSRTVAAVG